MCIYLLDLYSIMCYELRVAFKHFTNSNLEGKGKISIIHGHYPIVLEKKLIIKTHHVCITTILGAHSVKNKNIRRNWYKTQYSLEHCRNLQNKLNQSL